MKLLKVAIVAFVLLLNFCFVPASFADRGKFMKSPDYTEVNQAINALVQAKDNPDSGLSALEIQQKLAGLQLQKYILETSDDRATCTNQTGKNLGVYLRLKKAPASQAGTLYYLGNNESTDDDYTCTGIYLPSTTQVAFSPLEAAQELTEPIALKIVEGTQLIATANPQTGIIALNAPAQVIKAGAASWPIPTLTQADLDTQTPNAPQD